MNWNPCGTSYERLSPLSSFTIRWLVFLSTYATVPFVTVVVRSVTGCATVVTVAVRTVPGVSSRTVFGLPSMMNCRSAGTLKMRVLAAGLHPDEQVVAVDQHHFSCHGCLAR